MTRQATQRAHSLAGQSLVIDFLGLGYLLEEKYAHRAHDAGVDAINLTFGGEESWDQFTRIVEQNLQTIEKSDVLTIARTADDIRRARVAGKLAIVTGTQGASIIGEELWRVQALSRMGVRVLGIVGSFGNLYCDASSESRNAGLSLLGRELVAAINETPMLVDISHCGHAATRDVIELARAPVCTHANAYTIEPTDRNRKDEDIRALVKKGGMIGLCALPRSVKKSDPSLKEMLDHADHIKRLVGPEYLGLGLDLMEGFRENKKTNPALLRRRTLRPDIFGTMDDFWNDDIPHGFNSIVALPNLIGGLLERGWTEHEVIGVLGGNWMRTIESLQR